MSELGDEKKQRRISKESRKKAKRIFRYFRPHKGVFSLGFLFLLLSSSTSMIFPELMGRLINAGTLPRSTDSGLFDLDSINSIMIVLLIVFASQAFFSFFRIYIFSYVTESVLKHVRIDTFSNVIKLPMNFFSQRKVGELNSRIAADINLLQDTFTTTIAEFIRQFITIGIGISVITYYSPKLTLIMLSSVPVIVVFAVIFGRFIKKLSNQTQDQIADSNVIVQEAYSGISNVKSFSNEQFEQTRFTKSVNSIMGIAMKRAKWRASFVSFIVLFMTGTIALVVWYGAILQSQGEISSQEMTSFILYTVFVGASFGSLPDLYAKIVKAVGATEHLMDLIDETPESLSENRTVLNLKGEIEFDNVDFNYPSRDDVAVLKNVSFQIKSGETVALVGSSGAGKSTIASLILRFYDPSKGTITIDGTKNSEYELSALRNTMAIVPQEVILFGGSIKENVEYGNPGATDEEIVEACKQANAHDFIESFPEGYSTYVGDRGVQLSGGQKQRIAIARAILKNPSILILDEATSSLDSESERLVQSALDKIMKGRTSLVIAHRMSTIRNADKILVMHNGILAESGTHNELISKETGLYKRLCEFQYATETLS